MTMCQGVGIEEIDIPRFVNMEYRFFSRAREHDRGSPKTSYFCTLQRLRETSE
jgi:hypothetical protein